MTSNCCSGTWRPTAATRNSPPSAVTVAMRVRFSGLLAADMDVEAAKDDEQRECHGLRFIHTQRLGKAAWRKDLDNKQLLLETWRATAEEEVNRGVSRGGEGGYG